MGPILVREAIYEWACDGCGLHEKISRDGAIPILWDYITVSVGDKRRQQYILCVGCIDCIVKDNKRNIFLRLKKMRMLVTGETK